MSGFFDEAEPISVFGATGRNHFGHGSRRQQKIRETGPGTSAKLPWKGRSRAKLSHQRF
jgi:hypothetical protein